MQINVDLTSMLSNEEKETLINVLNCENEEGLTEKLVGISSASIAEYLEMILGKQLPSRANEIMERRLFHLLKHHFVDYIPSEAEVSTLFQLTESGSRTLLRNVRTRFKFDLKDELFSTVKNTLVRATERIGEYRVVIQSDNILEELKHTVSVKAPQLDQITRVKGSAGVHSIPEDTFRVLCDYYNINLAEVQAAPTEE